MITRRRTVVSVAIAAQFSAFWYSPLWLALPERALVAMTKTTNKGSSIIISFPLVFARSPDVANLVAYSLSQFVN